MSEKTVEKVGYAADIPILGSPDILVVGGSQSGVAAAVAARRTAPDADVWLIEKESYLGGQSVGTMVVQYEFRELVNNAGQRIAAGLADEIIRRIAEKGNSDPFFIDYIKGCQPPFTDLPDNRVFGDIPLDAEDIKYTLLEMCEEAGVKVFLDTKLVDFIPAPFGTDDRIIPETAIVSNIEGLFAIKPKVTVDCSANNDAAWFLGGRTEKYVVIPKNIVMPMQVYAWFGGVDVMKFAESIWENREKWHAVYPDNKEQMLQHVREGRVIQARGGADYIDEVEDKYGGIIDEYIATGALPPIYYWVKTVKTQKVDCGNGKTRYIGVFAIEGPSFSENGMDYKLLNKALKNQYKAVRLLLKMHKILPGWENCYIERTAVRMGFRQTRVIKGRYKLTGKDVREHRRFPDVIGRNTGHDIGRGNPEAEYGYDIPYRALLPEKIEYLLVGARSISCDPDEKSLTALNAQRGIVATMVVGHACGAAAGLAVLSGKPPSEISIEKLQQILREQGAVLDPPSEK